MYLKSFGCSFIFGTDLPDDGRDLPHATASQMTWPALLAKHQEIDYVCYARPGAGNLQILDALLTHLASNEKDLFVIGWTWIDRFDYRSENAPQWHSTPGPGWKTIMPIDTDSTAKFYYRDLHSEYRDKLTALTMIKLAIDTLQQKGCPFIMTYMDDLIFDTKYHVSPGMVDLQNYIRPYMTKFQDQTFLEFSRANGFEISGTMHPLQDAHRAAAEYLLTDITQHIKH